MTTKKKPARTQAAAHATSDKLPAEKPFSWLEYYPAATQFLARWTNAVAILNVLSDEFQALADIAAKPDPASCCLRPDEEQAKRVSLAVLSASEDALAPPFRGFLDAVIRSEKGGAA